MQTGSADYRVVHDGSPTIDGSSSSRITVLPAGTVVHRPLAPRAPGAAAGGPHRVTLRWRAPASDGGAAVTGCQVQRGTAPSTRRDVSTGGRSAVFRGLTAHRRYVLKVLARNQAGWSPWVGASARPHK